MMGKLPEEVNICAILYRVVEVEKMIVFTELCGMEFGGSRVAFTHPKYGLWQVEIKPQYGTSFSVAHIQEMFEYVREWRGDDFNRTYRRREGWEAIRVALYYIWLQKIWFPFRMPFWKWWITHMRKS
jgi:hypothetical protein